eukprot:3227633-Amphidinium_carterae.1
MAAFSKLLVYQKTSVSLQHHDLADFIAVSFVCCDHLFAVTVLSSGSLDVSVCFFASEPRGA